MISVCNSKHLFLQAGLMKTNVHSCVADVEIRDLEESLRMCMLHECHHQSSSELYTGYQYFSYCRLQATNNIHLLAYESEETRVHCNSVYSAISTLDNRCFMAF